MPVRRLFSASTLVAIVLAAVTAAVVIGSLGGTTSRAAAHDDPPEEDGTVGQASEPVVQASEPAGTSLAVGASGPDIVLADEWTLIDPLADYETAALQGSAVLTNDRSVAGAIAETRAPIEGECPILTDSIRRLYLGFLEQEPTETEFEGDIARYADGETNLEALAGVLAASGRFRDRYGPLSDEGYIRQAYANTLERSPREDELDHWLSALDTGYARGSVMLALTESAEFTRRTGTARPMTGYLNWYPAGVHWYCGVGARDDLPIRPLVDDHLYADYMLTNNGDDDVSIGLTTVLDGRTRVVMEAGNLPAGYSEFRWDGLFVGADNYGNGLDVVARSETAWAVAFYPHRIGRQRLGWNLPR